MKTKDICETNNQSGKTESIADLPLTAEQAEDTKAGTGAHSGGQGGGKVQMQDFHFFKK